MTRAGRREVPAGRSARPAILLAVAGVIALAASIEAAGPARAASGGAPAPSIQFAAQGPKPSHGIKPTPTPAPIATPVPPPVPTVAPVVTPPPTATPTPAPSPTPGPGVAAAPATAGPGTGSTPGSGGAQAGPGGPGGDASSTAPAGVAGIDAGTPGPSDVAAAAGSTRPVDSSGGTPSAAPVIVVVVVGILVIIAGWFLGTRRRTDPADRATADPMRARGRTEASGKDVRSREGSATRAGSTSTPMPPPARATRALEADRRLEDPLVAAIRQTRSHASQDAVGRGRSSPEVPASSARPLEPHRPARKVSSGRGALAEPASNADARFGAPAWVARLDPRIRIVPTPRIDPEPGASGPETRPDQVEARRSA